MLLALPPHDDDFGITNGILPEIDDTELDAFEKKNMLVKTFINTFMSMIFIDASCRADTEFVEGADRNFKLSS